MKDKAYAAIDDYKKAFKYVAIQQKEAEKEPEKKTKKEK